MSWLLQKIVHNEAMKADPKEIYGWRVFMLACSVSLLHALVLKRVSDTSLGLFWRDVVWHGLRDHWRCSHHATIPSVWFPPQCPIWR